MTDTPKPPPKRCPDCGVEISPRKTRCLECAEKHVQRLQL